MYIFSLDSGVDVPDTPDRFIFSRCNKCKGPSIKDVSPKEEGGGTKNAQKGDVY